MRLQLRLNLRRLVLALIALLSFGAILLKQSDGYLRASAAAQTVVSVNAASYEAGPLARGSLASVFGNNLAAETVKSQDVPPLTELGGVKVKVTDGKGVTRDAGLVMVSPQQINFVISDEAAPGPGDIVIMNGSVTVAKGELKIVDAKPALFTSGSSDTKLAVGMTSANGYTPQSLVNTDGSPSMVGPGALWAPTSVTLLGTGIRYASSVQVRIGDQLVEPTFVGQDDSAPGVDKVTFRMPRMSRGGMNTLSLVVNTRSSATASSGATTQAAGAAQSSETTVTSNAAQVSAIGPAPPSPSTLSAADVQLIIAQAVAKAQQMGFAATFAVLDTEGNPLGIFKMNGARSDILVGSTNLVNGKPTRLLQNGMVDPDGLELLRLPLSGAPPGLLSDAAALAAISKAGTAAFFSTQGSAISTRTASSIIQEFFPVGISSQPAGPLFGVQFSQLPCSDVRNPSQRRLGNLPLGLAGDPGGLPIYKNGVAVGGFGVEGDGFYSIDVSIQDNKGPFAEQSTEEIIATAGIKGFRVAPVFQADNLLVDGMRLEYSNVVGPGDGPPAPPYASLPGAAGTELLAPSGQQFSGFSPLTLGGVPGRVTQGFFPFKDSQVSSLTAADVTRILTQAARGAYALRAAIRIGPSAGLPAQPTEVNISVVDTAGNVLGLFSTQDAPQFGFDVCVQKARTAVFFSLPNAGALLRSADANVTNIVPGLSIGKYADLASAFGVPLNGQFVFTSRAMGTLARPFFPDGIVGAPNGPFSKDIRFWSPFNDGLQIALVKPALASILTGATPPSGTTLSCSPIPNTPILANGFQIFAGSAALFKNGVLVGAIGVSGDGIDQDDFCAGSGAFGYEPPAAVRADQLLIRNVRLTYLKYPRHPNIGNPSPNPPIIRTSRVFSNSN
jgi:uncharacterized protein (TIGR03437 family)